MSTDDLPPWRRISPRQARVIAVRRFESFFGRRMRKADASIRELGGSRAEVEVLQALRTAKHARTQARLAGHLEMDPAHVCRIVKRLVALGLVTLEAGGYDARRKDVSLRIGGVYTLRVIEGHDNDRVRRMLDSLPQRQQVRLVEAMVAIEEVLTRDEIDNLMELAREMPDEPEAPGESAVPA